MRKVFLFVTVAIAPNILFAQVKSSDEENSKAYPILTAGQRAILHSCLVNPESKHIDTCVSFCNKRRNAVLPQCQKLEQTAGN